MLVSRSLPGACLSETLRKVDSVAARACYLTWRAERSDEFEITVSRALGKHPHEYPDYNIIYETLSCLGIPAKTEIFETINEESFPSLDEAVLNMARGAKLNPEQLRNLHIAAEGRLTCADGFYCSRSKLKWALISWQK